jgi:predicted phosphodiesterase
LKTAIISDIHGNLTALECVLSAIENADQIICLGDVASVGPQPHDTVTLLGSKGWPVVMGNTDEALASSTLEDYKQLHVSKEERGRMTTLDRWTAAELDDIDRRFLAGFKPTIELKDGHSSMLCYHGSPRSNTEGILSTTPDRKLTRILAGRAATIYAGGHTHTQMVRKFGTSIVINPGSIGLPFFRDRLGRFRNPTWAEYAMVTTSSSDLKVDLRRKKYSLRSLEKVVRRSGLPNPDWWLADWVSVS